MNNKRGKLISESINVPFMDCKNISNLINEYSQIPYLYTTDSKPIKLEMKYDLGGDDDNNICTEFVVYKLDNNLFLVYLEKTNTNEFISILDKSKLKRWIYQKNDKYILEELKEEDLLNHIFYPGDMFEYQCKCNNCKNKEWKDIDKKKCPYTNLHMSRRIKTTDKDSVKFYFKKWFNRLHNLAVLDPNKIWNITCNYDMFTVYSLKNEDDYEEVEITKTQIKSIHKKFEDYIDKFINECNIE